MDYKVPGKESPTRCYFSQSPKLGESREGMTEGMH